jgi:hypothetical protein
MLYYTVLWSFYKDLNRGPLCPQFPTLTSLPSLHVHVHLKNHFTFSTLMSTLDRQKKSTILINYENFEIIKINKKFK